MRLKDDRRELKLTRHQVPKRKVLVHLPDLEDLVIRGTTGLGQQRGVSRALRLILRVTDSCGRELVAIRGREAFRGGVAIEAFAQRPQEVDVVLGL